MTSFIETWYAVAFKPRDFVIRLTGDGLGDKSPCSGRCFPMHTTLLACGQLRVCEIRSTTDIWNFGIGKISVVVALKAIWTKMGPWLFSCCFFRGDEISYNYRVKKNWGVDFFVIFREITSPKRFKNIHRFSTWLSKRFCRYSSSIEDVGLAGVKAGELLGEAAGRPGGESWGKVAVS